MNKMDLGKENIAFLALIRAGLYGINPVDDLFPVKEIVWKRIFLLSRKQTVEGVVFDGIQLLPKSSFPPLPLLLKWTAIVDRLERQNLHMNKVVIELGKIFSENGIKAFLLKGQGVAACYGSPLHRVCGDIDWCFLSKKEWEKANSLMKDRGITLQRQAGFSTMYEWKGCLIEHHRRALDIHNPLLQSYLDRLLYRELYCFKPLKMECGMVNILSPLLTHISVISHILKHMLSFGIGLRQFCDVACVYSRYSSLIDGSELEVIYRKIGIYRFVQVLNALLVEQLGMPVKFLPFPLSGSDNSWWMMDDVLRVGNFGFYDERYGCNGKRENTADQLMRRFRRGFSYAPGESCWYPIMQVYSYIYYYFNKN